jgi:hypothetical protein
MKIYRQLGERMYLSSEGALDILARRKSDLRMLLVATVRAGIDYGTMAEG